ncbi:MAG: hypothetical protein IKK82_09385, partial [Kiritimatiellae bacterium]|nr:hypothetical protein [Kiritimatiellia bacterium]
MNRLLFAALAMVSASLVYAETKVGIIGLDTSHSIAFTKIMNVDKDPAMAGFRVAAAYKWGSMAIMVGMGRGAEAGILFRNGTALETLHATRCILLDKTGT